MIRNLFPRLSAMSFLLMVFFFASCSRESLQVQKWNKLDYSQAYNRPAQGSEVAAAAVKEVPAAMVAETQNAVKLAQAVTPAPVKKTIHKTAKKSVVAREVMKVAANKMTKKLEKQADAFAYNKVTKKVRHSDDIQIDSDLRLALLFFIVGLIVAIIGGLIPILGVLFVVIGSILMVVGLIFLLLWLLDQA